MKSDLALFPERINLLTKNPIKMTNDRSQNDHPSIEGIIFSSKEWWILIFLFLFSIIGVLVCTQQNEQTANDYIEMTLR